MFHAPLRKILCAAVLFLTFAVQHAVAETVSVPFSVGFAGTVGSNSGQANAIKNFATLGVSKAFFIQTSASGQFGGTQGNDLSGTMRLVFNSGQTIDIPGAISWRISQGATLNYFGFIPAPGAATHVITYGSNQQYTLNASSNYGLRKIGSAQSFADGSNVSGNAATSGLVSLLNDYLTTVQANGPKITGPSGASGAASSALTVNENQTSVATLTADKTVSWSIFGGTDGGKFTINATTGVLTFRAAPDFEQPTDADANNTYIVTVQATDSGGYTAQQSVTVTVADLDDTPPVITAPSGGAVTAAEGQTAVTGLTADEAVVWSVSGGADAALFAVDAAGVVTFLSAPDFAAPGDADGDNIYVVTIRAVDGAGNASTTTLTVTVTDVVAPDDTPPAIKGPSDRRISVPDAQMSVAILRADEQVTWSITGGADRAALVIDAVTGAVRFVRAPDHSAPTDANRDNTYVVRILATDASGNTSTIILRVAVVAPDDVVAEVFDRYRDDVARIVKEIELNHLKASVASLQGMTVAARDRFIAAREMRERCATADDADITDVRIDPECSLIATRNNVPFSVHGEVQAGVGGSFTKGTFFGQTGDFAGTRRRIVSGDFSVVDNGAGVTTSSMTARIASERMVSDRVMLGYFAGASFGNSAINKRLEGRSDQISLSMGSYFVAELRKNLQLDGFLSVGASRNMLTLGNEEIQLDGTYAARSVLMGLAMSGVIEGDGFELRPEIAVAYGAAKIGTVHLDATVAGTTKAVTSPATDVDYATLRITPELRIPVYANSDAATYILAPSLLCDWNNGQGDCGGGLRLGLQGTSRDQMTRFDIMIDAERIGRRDRLTLQANVEYRF